MKKIFSALVALLLCCAMVTSAFAGDFTPSVSNKGAPDIVPVYDQNGNPQLGTLNGASGSVDSYVEDDCLIVTSIANLADSDEIPDSSAAMLLFVYNGLSSGEMQLPYDKMGYGLSADNTAIRDLFDVTWMCGDHPEELNEPGTTLTLTFDLGIAPGTKVHALTYKNNEWNPIAKVINNGNGTVTCVFEHLCPVAFVVETGVATGGLLGDVNSDGVVDSLDAMLILRWDAELIGADALNLNVGDVNGDKLVDSVDAMLILRLDAELIDKLPAA